MGLLRKLFGTLFGEEKAAARVTSNDVEAIVQSASRMADIVNESLKIAGESKNLDTRRSRLRVAKQRLAELNELAETYEFLELSSLAEIEDQVALLEIELQSDDEFDGNVEPGVDDLGEAANSYFNTMSQMQEAITSREYELAMRLARDNLRQVPGFVRHCVAEYGSFDAGLPVVHRGGTVMALLGEDEALQEMREMVESIPELRPLRDEMERHLEDRVLFSAILSAVEENPQCLQPEVKKLVACDDGHRIAALISWLEKAGKIVRTKTGRTYAIGLPETTQSTPVQPRVVSSHRSGKSTQGVNLIDLSSLSYVPLPRAPLQWEEREKRAAEINEVADGFFEVREADTWELTEAQKVPVRDRPDPAFRRIYPTDSGLTLIDDLGNAEEFAGAPAAAMCFDREGSQLHSRPLLHGVYRTGVNVLGCGFVAMSKECVVHAYDDDISPTLETAMREAPEVLALQKRLGIVDEELHRLCFYVL